MSRRACFYAALYSYVALVTAAGAFGLAFLFSQATAASAMLTSSPAHVTLVSSGLLIGGDASDVISLLQATQGASLADLHHWALFNPGADIDLTTTTDFEDLAGPAADVLEFGDQDRALLADSLTSSTLFLNGFVGAGVGVAAYAILSSDLVRLF